MRLYFFFALLAAVSVASADPGWVLTSADFRHAFASGISANSIAFERDLFDHYRLVFERR